MTVQTETVLKGYFNSGDSPTETQIAALIESALRKRTRRATATPVTVVDAEDQVIVVVTTTIAAPVTVNLPAGSNGKVLWIIDDAIAATHNITIDGNAAETINGAATYVISTNRARVCLVWDSTQWVVLSA